MFAKLRGKIDKIIDNQLILDVNGVGYLVTCSNSTIQQIADVKGDVALLIETVVREDSINLYGFASEIEKTWFNLLLDKVSGVGPKMAINVLSCVTPQELVMAISAKDKNIFKKGSGIGPKIAERIITELKDVVGKMGMTENVVQISSGGKQAAASKQNSLIDDAVAALEKLGFARFEAYSTVNKLTAVNPEITLQEIIKQGLKELSKIA